MAAEKRYYDILILLLHSGYNDISSVVNISPTPFIEKENRSAFSFMMLILISSPVSTFCCSLLPSIVLSFSFFYLSYDIYFGQSPLFAASMFGSCDVVKCLLNSGAEINLCDKFGTIKEPKEEFLHLN
jgi:ankyrin repeat protein